MESGTDRKLIERLNGFLFKNQILDSELWREIYARDASYFDIKPKCIVRPKNIDEVRQVIRVARESGLGVTFRTGGTSLSGQTVNNGIICELRTQWNRCEVRDDGRRVWFEPGLTADQVNRHLRGFHTHIGPDPASSSAAMMGGILANNSSGMEAGVRHNSYHTLSSIEFMLSNGNSYDSAIPAGRKRFHEQERELCKGLAEIRQEIISDTETREKIIRKYRIKNVTGYAMNSFVDFEDPFDIFCHLLIGSEGTLAYIISAELNTLPLYSTYTSSMLYFPDVTSAAASAAWLGNTGALAVEMMDYASLRSSQGLKSDMPQGTTAMLIDYGADSPETLAETITSLEPQIRKIKNLSGMDQFTHTVAERAHLWRIRDGVFPCVAGARIPGATVILEDIAAPVEQLDRLVEGVQNLFRLHGYDGAIFGHARDGNIHPLVTAKMDSAKATDNFKRFMEKFVEHTLNLDGSLKGEHGTGRAIAPFVSLEWGDKIYGLMCRVKKLADPSDTLNPGVMINPDPDAFIRPIKSMDLFGEELGYARADKCMECGYCEHVCPSRNVTLTPRQRLQALRVISHTDNEKLRREYAYIGRDTCCSDGSCQLPCPMGINTGTITDAVRERSNGSLIDKTLSMAASRYGTAETTIRNLLKTAVLAEKVISPYPLIWASDFMHSIYRQTPHWSKYFPMPEKIRFNDTLNPDFIYFPACVTRIFGGSSIGKDDMITVIMRLGALASLRIALPKEVHGLCCSQIWEHKGDPEGQKTIANKTVETFYELTDSGRIPIFCDTTSCTHSLLSLAKEKDMLTEENTRRYATLKIMDITRWLLDHVLPAVKINRRKKKVALHPTCAARILGLDGLMTQIAEACAEEVIVPGDAYCCGAAGDRGFIFSEVAQSATRDERSNLADEKFDGYYSLARTCEISMMSTIGRPYESIVYLVDETTAG